MKPDVFWHTHISVICRVWSWRWSRTPGYTYKCLYPLKRPSLYLWRKSIRIPLPNYASSSESSLVRQGTLTFVSFASSFLRLLVMMILRSFRNHPYFRSITDLVMQLCAQTCVPLKSGYFYLICAIAVRRSRPYKIPSLTDYWKNLVAPWSSTIPKRWLPWNWSGGF